MQCYICDGVFVMGFQEYQGKSGKSYRVCDRCIKANGFPVQAKEPIVLNADGQIIPDYPGDPGVSDSDSNEIILQEDFDFGQGN